MTGEGLVQPGASAAQSYSGRMGGEREPTNLGDILERVLDKGLVIAGDIRVNLLDIELLTIKLRLVIASVQTARELGIDWWESDPWLSSNGSNQRQLAEENRRLRQRLAAVERDGSHRAVEGTDEWSGREPAQSAAARPQEGRGEPRA